MLPLSVPSFTFYEILDINVSFLQTCQNIIPGCTPQNAAQFLGLPVLFNLAGYVVGALTLSPFGGSVRAA